MKTTAIIGGGLSGIAVTHMLQKKGIPKENIALFEETPGGGEAPECPQKRPRDAGTAFQLQADGPFRRQLYREMGVGEDTTTPSSKEATLPLRDASFSVGHYVWKDSTSLSASLLACLLSPVSTAHAVWVYTWFVRESMAFLSADSVGKMGIKEFCKKGGYDTVWKEYLMPMVTLLWGVAEEDAGVVDAGMVIHFMHEKNLLQVWSPHVLVLYRSITSLKQLVARDGDSLFTVMTERVTSINQESDDKWRVNGKGTAYDNIVFAVKPSSIRDILVVTKDGHRPEILETVVELCQEVGNSSLTEASDETDTHQDAIETIAISALSRAKFQSDQIKSRTPLDNENRNSERRVILTSNNLKMSKQVMQSQGQDGIWVTGCYLKNGFDDGAVDNADEVTDMIRGSATGLIGRHWGTTVHRRTDMPFSGVILWFLKTLLTYGLRKLIRKGCIGVVFPDSSVEFFGEKGVPIAMLNIYRIRCIPQMAIFHTIGFGLAYRDEHLNTDDMTLLFYILCQNLMNNRQVSRLYIYFKKLCRLPYIISHHFRLGISQSRSKKNTADHYGLDGSMFQLFLDENMVYSSAFYKNGKESLKEAQIEKMDLLLSFLEAEDGDRLLDMGCGWGFMCSTAATKNNCKVTGITNSQDHKRSCDELVLKHGLQDRVAIYDLDYRDLPKLFRSDKFDKIVAIESTEHVGVEYYSEYFKSLKSVLSENGKICLQVICRHEDDYDFEKRNPDFITYFIFPGSCAPSLGALCKHAARNGLAMKSVLNISAHYEKTLHTWRENFNRAVIDGRMLYDDKFARMWNVYFSMAEAAMAADVLMDHVITFERIGNKSYSYLQNPIPSNEN